MAGRPLRPATHRRLGEPLPHQQANGAQAHPRAAEAFDPVGMSRRDVMRYYNRFPGIIPHSRADYLRVTHPFATVHPAEAGFLVRLACVKHAASVRPEPGSNSPL